MKKIKILLIGILVVGMVVGIAGVSWGALPTYPFDKINIQGRLTEADVPLDGTVSIVFKIYDRSTGGVAQWSETKDVTVTNGIFNVILGTNPINIDWEPETTRYFLGIKVGTASEMEPRQELVSVPFAMVAKNLKGGRVNAESDLSGSDWDHDISVGYFNATGTTGNTKAIIGTAKSVGVEGRASGRWGRGVWGTNSDEGCGVYGMNLSEGENAGIGVKGKSNKGYGVYGESTSGDGVYGFTESWEKAGVYGYSALGKGIEGKSDFTAGVFGESTNPTYAEPWWYLVVPVGATIGKGDGLVGVHGSSTKNYGVYGFTASSGRAGVYGESLRGHGIWGKTGGGNKAGVVGLSK